jgi:pyridinium-3,5-bisthiocarboxylic acid mononucleotide nickel chelatase
VIHIHLDPVGGVAGDMFIAAMLHAFPQLEAPMIAAIRAAGLPKDIGVRIQPFQDFALTGLRFLVDEPPGAAHRSVSHEHRAFADISAALTSSALERNVRDRAIDMFTRLADVEGEIHGVSAQEVSFHELGGWDSIADMVGAAYLIESCGAVSWSIGSLPKGAGMVNTAHGPLPVPSPATARLLEGYAWHDDGRPGERVTPTGAAIVRHLRCAATLPPGGQRLSASGYGFGTRRFMGMSNTLRVMVFDDRQISALTREEIAVVQFELDDQTAEDIALAIGDLREMEGVLDVLQMPAFGKKGRLMTHLQLLCAPAVLEGVLVACFGQTGTLGIRYHIVQRAILPREKVTVAVDAAAMQVKVTQRPGGDFTAKLESDELQNSGAATRAQRERIRYEAEHLALDKKATKK